MDYEFNLVFLHRKNPKNGVGTKPRNTKDQMIPEEYMQLKAFARIDGALLSVMWIASFACYIAGLSAPLLMMCGMMLAVCSPLFAAVRLRKFRDGVRDGVISFRRGYAYTILVFFYAALLFAIAQFAYFQFIDEGYLVSRVMEMMDTVENRQVIQAYGMGDVLDGSLRQMAQTRPIDYALSYLTVNIVLGFVLGLPIAAVMKKAR